MVRTPKIWSLFFESFCKCQNCCAKFWKFLGEMPKCPPPDCAPALFDTVVKSLNYFMLSVTTRMNWAWLMIGPLPSRNCTSWNGTASSASWAKIECSAGETIRLSTIVVWTVSFGFLAVWYFGFVVFLTSFLIVEDAISANFAISANLESNLEI